MDKKLKTVIDNELVPLKESIETLEESASVLKERNSQLLTETETLRKENSALQDSVLKLSKRNSRLVHETKLVLTKSHESVQAAKRKLEESKKLFVESASQALEEHINEITRSAFNAAKTIFEKDFNVIENDLMKEVGALFSPYMADKTLPSKISKLESQLAETNQTLTAIKSSSLKAIRRETIAKKQAERKLQESLVALRDTKLTQFKDNLVNKLPSSLRESASDKLAKADTIAEVKRIYLSVVKESADNVKTVKPNPVEDKQKTVVTESVRPEVVKEAARVSVTLNNKKVVKIENEDDAFLNDPEILSRAGIV
jgi:hypothetical protein